MSKYEEKLNLKQVIANGNSSPTYFIADIAANHDGDIKRAIQLIKLAAESGANAAKFQNFRAETIVSRKGFEEVGKLSHQEKWQKSVFDVYKAAELPISWTQELIEACTTHGIEYFTAPYDLEYLSYFNARMDYFKVGSGDITWKESLEVIKDFGKPVLLATGASNQIEVDQALLVLNQKNTPIILMQCNTNYTGRVDNYEYLNLNVLKSFRDKYPEVILGLSDHSPGHLAVLGAVALGARVIEKHFTDDTSRVGPDHNFSLDPNSWRKMVDEIRILEKCLGDGIKKVEENEIESRVIQRRGLRFNKSLSVGHQILKSDLIAVRPCPENAINPFEIEKVLGKTLRVDVEEDTLVTLEILA